MSKQILILNGSPRIHGNTAALIDAFTAGAEAAGHTITRFDLAALDIHGCRGCLGGGRDPRHPCVQRDGMDAVYPAYMAADVVVLASPMYYWSISGQLKCAFDRLFAVAELGPDLANPVKDAVLLMAAEGDTEENFAPVRAYYKALLDCLGWKDAGIVYAGGNMAVGDIQAHPEQLEAARWLPYLKPGGVLITNSQRIDPMPVIMGKAVYPENILPAIAAKGVQIKAVDAKALALEAGNVKAANVVLLGLTARYLGLDKAIWMDILRATVPPKTVAVNEKAFELGYAAKEMTF